MEVDGERGGGVKAGLEIRNACVTDGMQGGLSRGRTFIGFREPGGGSDDVELAVVWQRRGGGGGG